MVFLCTYSIAQGSASVTCCFAIFEFRTNGTGTARSGSASFEGLSRVTVKVSSSTAANWSGRSRPPAAIWVVGKPPTETARSKDHFTSSAVTLEPSWKTASGLSLKVMTLPSSETVQLCASSGTMVE